MILTRQLGRQAAGLDSGLVEFIALVQTKSPPGMIPEEVIWVSISGGTKADSP